MNIRALLTRALTIVFVIAVCLLVVGTVLDQPVLLSYVETGSMEPTLSSGDGFVAIPSAIAGPVEKGDVIVFRGQTPHGGHLTTHRVVASSEDGYITKGDANPFTDQDGGEPPVKDAQIVAQVLEIDGSVVVIPSLGTVVTGVRGVISTIQRQLGMRGLAYLFFAVTVLIYAVDALCGGDSQRTRSRQRATVTDTRLIIGAFAALLVLGATASMVVPAGTQQYEIVSATFESSHPNVVPVGDSKNYSHTVANNGIVPVYVFFEPMSEGIVIHPREMVVQSHSFSNATVTLSDSFGIVVIVLVIVTLLGGWLTYTTHVASATHTEERVVTMWESTGAFDHSATITNGSEAFPSGTTLSNQSVYFTSIAPVLNGTFTYTYDAAAGDLTTNTTLILVLHSIREAGGGNATEYWRITRTLGTQRTNSLGPDEPQRLKNKGDWNTIMSFFQIGRWSI